MGKTTDATDAPAKATKTTTGKKETSGKKEKKSPAPPPPPHISTFYLSSTNQLASTGILAAFNALNSSLPTSSSKYNLVPVKSKDFHNDLVTSAPDFADTSVILTRDYSPATAVFGLHAALLSLQPTLANPADTGLLHQWMDFTTTTLTPAVKAYTKNPNKGAANLEAALATLTAHLAATGGKTVLSVPAVIDTYLTLTLLPILPTCALLTPTADPTHSKYLNAVPATPPFTHALASSSEFIYTSPPAITDTSVGVHEHLRNIFGQALFRAFPNAAEQNINVSAPNDPPVNRFYIWSYTYAQQTVILQTLNV